MKKLCKFCDERATSCAGRRTCKVECEITSICPNAQDVCVTIWCVCPDCNTHRYFATTQALLDTNLPVFAWCGEKREREQNFLTPLHKSCAPKAHVPLCQSAFGLEQSDGIMTGAEQSDHQQ